MSQRHHGNDLAAMLHGGPPVAAAQQQLVGFIGDLLAEGAAGELRPGVPLDELAVFCLHAFDAAGPLPTEQAVTRLVTPP